MKKTIFALLMMCGALSANSQLRNDQVYKFPERDIFYSRMNFRVPNIEGYKTLKGDFHMHTVFSDGKVWPDVRVNEAWRDGLDVIAITDHIEYRPNYNILKGDLNESYKIAAQRGAELGILVVQGTEITRDKPVGHVNALFVTDANLLNQTDPEAAMNEARKQNAVVMFNHPGWPDNNFVMSDILRKWFNEKRFDALEIYNHLEWYPIVLELMDEYNLAYISNSDIHQPIADRYGVGRGLRPMTILFCKDHSLEGVRDAIKSKRTLSYFDDTLLGREDLMRQFVKECLSVRVMNNNRYEIINNTDLGFELTVGDAYYKIAPNSTVGVVTSTPELMNLKNCIVGRNKTLKLDWK